MKHHVSGFTLIELMIAIAIIAIIASIAYPSYQEQVRSSRRSTAMGDLQSLAQALERYFNANDTYVGAGTVGGPPTVYASESPIDSSTKYYDLTTAVLTGTTYTVRATPKGSQAGDGIIELSFTGARTWDENNDGTISASERDWDKN